MNERVDPKEKFAAAIMEYLTSEGYDDELLMDWYLITAQHKMHDEDGDPATMIGLFGSDNQSIHKSIGLVEYAKYRLMRKILQR